jgi:hypothetical protein
MFNAPKLKRAKKKETVEGEIQPSICSLINKAKASKKLYDSNLNILWENEELIQLTANKLKNLWLEKT